jgi:RecB family exonuclease
MSGVPGLAAIEAAATAAAQLALAKRVSKQHVLAAASVAAQCSAGGATAADAVARSNDFIGRLPLRADGKLRLQRIQPDIDTCLAAGTLPLPLTAASSAPRAWL